MSANTAQPGKRRWVPVVNRKQMSMSRNSGQQPLDMAFGGCRAAAPRPLRRLPARIEAVGGRHGEDADVPEMLRRHACGGHRFRRHDTLIGDDQLAIGAGTPQPIGAVDQVVLLAGGELSHRLLQFARRTAEIDRAAGVIPKPCGGIRIARAVALHVVERPFHDRPELVHEGGLECGQTVLSHADQRCADGLVGAPLRRQRDPGGGGHQQETGILVAGIVQRIEAPGNERIIESADRQQPFAEQRMGQPGGSQGEEQVVFGDPQFDMLTAGIETPLLAADHLFLAEGIADGLRGEEVPPIDPRSQVGRYADIRRQGHDPVRVRLVGTADFVEYPAEPFLGRGGAGRGFRQRGNRNGFCRRAAIAAGVERYRGQEGVEIGLRNVDPLAGFPFMPRRNAHGLSEAGHLIRRQNAGMVVLVAGERQSPSLDGIGDEAHRTIVIDGGEGIDQGRQAVAAEGLHQFGQFPVGPAGNEGKGIVIVREVVKQPLPPCGASLIGQRRVEGIGAVVDPPAQRFAAGLGEGGPLQCPVFQGDHVPVERGERLLDPAVDPFVNDSVQALAVIVDDPPGVAEFVLPSFEQALVDIALVQFRVAHQGDHPARFQRAAPVLGPDVILDHGGECGHRRPKAHRPG